MIPDTEWHLWSSPGGDRPAGEYVHGLSVSAARVSGLHGSNAGVPVLTSAMHLVEIFLPVTGHDGAVLGDDPLATTRDELTQRFGGMTAFSRSPAKGVWEKCGTKVRDDIVVVEVMVSTLDLEWWRNYRTTLERRFHQEKILVRATKTQEL